MNTNVRHHDDGDGDILVSTWLSTIRRPTTATITTTIQNWKLNSKLFSLNYTFDPFQRPTHLHQRLRFGGFSSDIARSVNLLTYLFTYFTVSQKIQKNDLFSLSVLFGNEEKVQYENALRYK